MEYTFYRIFCKDETIRECYIGSTKNYKRRREHHITSINSEKDKNYNQPVYKFIRENGGKDNWIWEILGTGFYENKNDLYKMEREWIEKYDKTLNYQIPSRSRKEYREQNKDEIINKKKEYREQNKDLISEKMKEYREQNKDRINARKKEYYEENKDLIRERNKIKIVCECGSIVRKNCLSRHRKTKKHRELIH